MSFHRYSGCYSHKKGDGRSARYRYSCVQLDKRQQESKKVEDARKHRDRECMQTYSCNGWLNITVNPSKVSEVLISLVHKCDHPPYWSIDIPDNVKELIRVGSSISKTPSQVSDYLNISKAVF